jgi:hypothetical protein
LKVFNRFRFRWRLLISLVAGLAGWWFIDWKLAAKPLHTLRFPESGEIADFSDPRFSYGFAVAPGPTGRQLLIGQPNVPQEGQVTFEVVDLPSGRSISKSVSSRQEFFRQGLCKLTYAGWKGNGVLVNTHREPWFIRSMRSRGPIVPLEDQRQVLIVDLPDSSQCVNEVGGAFSLGDTLDRLIAKLPILAAWLYRTRAEVGIWDKEKREFLWSIPELYGESEWSIVLKSDDNEYFTFFQHRNTGNELFVFKAPFNLTRWSPWWSWLAGLLLTLFTYILLCRRRTVTEIPVFRPHASHEPS